MRRFIIASGQAVKYYIGNKKMKNQSYKAYLGILLMTVLLFLTACGTDANNIHAKKKKKDEPKAAVAETAEEETVDEDEKKDPGRLTEETWETVMTNIKTLAGTTKEVRDFYNLHRELVKNPELEEAFARSDELCKSMKNAQMDDYNCEEAVGIIQEIDEIFDIYIHFVEKETPQKGDVEKLLSILNSALWIDSNLNTYAFDAGKDTMYVVMAGTDNTVSGTYLLEEDEEGSLKITISTEDFLIEGTVIGFSSNTIEIKDGISGERIVLVPVG